MPGAPPYPEGQILIMPLEKKKKVDGETAKQL